MERLPRQNPLPLFISGRCGKTDVALLDADFVRTRGPERLQFSDAPLLALLPTQQSNLSRHRAWASHHLRGLFSSITPHVAAAVIPPSAMSSKTSSGVPRVIIFATLVVVLVTCVEVCAPRWRRPM